MTSRASIGILTMTLSLFLLAGATLAADVESLFAPASFTSAQTGWKAPYRLLSPQKIEPGQKYPLVLFLHGAGERGSDNGRPLKHGVKAFAADDLLAKHPAFVLVLQCADDHLWVDTPWSAPEHTMPAEPSRFMRIAMELVDAVRAQQPIDDQRIYVVGISMGGFGAWDAIQRQPEVFAAAVPVCGGGDVALASKIKDVPVWAFHGAKDGVVKVKRSRDMIEALKAAGGEPKYTEYPNVDHNAWDKAFATPELFDWLFAQKKAKPAPKATLPAPVATSSPATAAAPKAAAPGMIFTEDFEDNESGFMGKKVEVVAADSVTPAGTGKYMGKFSSGLAFLRLGKIPDGATTIVIEYRYMYPAAPTAEQANTQYVRQYIRFDSTGDTRHGQDTRFKLSESGKGKWHTATLKIKVPQGATKMTSLEFANLIEGKKDKEFDNPVYFDDYVIRFE